MLNQFSIKLIVERIKYFENAGIDLNSLIEDSHFLSELPLYLMFMETEGINSNDTFHNLLGEVKDFVKIYIEEKDND